MNSKLLNEINRINEMMSVPNKSMNLLLEQNIGKTIAKIYDDLSGAAINRVLLRNQEQFGKLTRNFEIELPNGKMSTAGELDDLKKTLNEPGGYGKLEGEDLLKANRILGSIPEYSQPAYRQFLSSWGDSESKMLSDFYEYYKGIRRSGQDVTLSQAIDDFFGTDDPYAALYKGQVNRRVTEYATAEATGTLDEFKYLDDVADDAARSGDEVVDVVDDAAGKSGKAVDDVTGAADDAAGKSGKAVDDVTGAADDAAGKSGRASDDVAGTVDDKADDATDTTEPIEPKTAEPIPIDPDSPNRLNQDLVSVGKTLDDEGEKFIDDLLDPSGNWFQKFGRKFQRKISTKLDGFLRKSARIQKQTVELLERAARETDAGKKTKLVNQARENLTTLARMDAEEYTSMVTWIDDYLGKTGVDGRALVRSLSQNQSWLQFEKIALEGTFWQKLWRGFEQGFADYFSTWSTLRSAWAKAFVNILDWGLVVPGLIRTIIKKGNLSFLAKFTPEERTIFWRWFRSGYTTGKPIKDMVVDAYRVGGVPAVVARMAGPVGLRALKASVYLTAVRTIGGSIMTSQGWFDEPIIIPNPFNGKQYDIAPLLKEWFPHQKIYEEDDIRSNFIANFRKNFEIYFGFTIPAWYVGSEIANILESGSDETLDEDIRRVENEAQDIVDEVRDTTPPVVLLPKLKNQLEDEGLIVDEVKPYIGRENNKYYCNCYGGRATIDKLKNIYPDYNEPDKDKFVVVWNADDKYFSLAESLVPSECTPITVQESIKGLGKLLIEQPTSGGTPAPGPSDGGSAPSDGGSAPSDGGSAPSNGGSTPSNGGRRPRTGNEFVGLANYNGSLKTDLESAINAAESGGRYAKRIADNIGIHKDSSGNESIVIAGMLLDGLTPEYFPVEKNSSGQWGWINTETSNRWTEFDNY